MFTGLVEALVEIVAVTEEPPGRRLRIRWPQAGRTAAVGDSIALNGCCLTVVAQAEDDLEFEAGPETLQRTNLGALTVGDRINVERSLSLGDRLGGHLVTGHIDALGTLVDVRVDGPWQTMWFAHARELGRQVASKGSIAVDGVSLTVVDAEPERFSVALIPHTLAVTTLGQARLGQRVNLETDLLAKYVARQLESRAAP